MQPGVEGNKTCFKKDKETKQHREQPAVCNEENEMLVVMI